jgi:dipeptidyl aminopeptidase/acylaminoacyl peptidase
VPVIVFPPRNPGYRPEPGTRVPYLLFLPDGPGAQADRMLDPVKVVFTSRGFGVAVVEVRGSSGYGRRYREQVYGRWGLADVEDCATGVGWPQQ